VDDYTHTLTFKNQDTYTIESIPKPEAPVVWGKLVHIVDREGIPRSADFYDEEGQIRRTLTFEDVREIGGRRIPTNWIMVPQDGSGKRTVLQLEAVQFNPEIANSVFTQANMYKNGR
jgi:outer membrane lipoprotein-sorting protein